MKDYHADLEARKASIELQEFWAGVICLVLFVTLGFFLGCNV